MENETRESGLERDIAKIEYIRAKAIEANPSIIELGFGVRVRFEGKRNGIIVGRNNITTKRND